MKHRRVAHGANWDYWYPVHLWAELTPAERQAVIKRQTKLMNRGKNAKKPTRVERGARAASSGG